MSQIADLIQSAADVLFVPVLVVVLFGTGIFLTLRLAPARPPVVRSHRSRRS
jgi:Na+/alanine symporter